MNTDGTIKITDAVGRCFVAAALLWLIVYLSRRDSQRLDVIEDRMKSVEWTAHVILTNALPWTADAGPVYLLNEPFTQTNADGSVLDVRQDGSRALFSSIADYTNWLAKSQSDPPVNPAPIKPIRWGASRP